MAKNSVFRTLDRLLANDQYEEGLKMFEALYEIDGELAILKTKYYVVLGQFEECNRFLDSFFFTENNFDEVDLARSNIARAFNYANLGYLDRADTELIKAEHKVFMTMDQPKDQLDLKEKAMVIEWYYTKAFVLRRFGKPAKGLEYLNIIVRWIDDELYLKNPLLVARLFNEMGALNYFLGRLSECDEYWKECFALRKKVGNRFELANSYNNLASLSIKKGEVQNAEELLKKALEFFREIRSRREMSRVYNNLGLLYETKNELEEAETHLQMALAINTSLGDLRNIANTMNNLGKVYIKKGEYEEAEGFLLKSLELLRGGENPIMESEALMSLITLNYELRRKQEAKKYIDRLKLLRNKTQNRLIRSRYDLSRALYSRFSTRILSQGEAQMRFRKIIENPEAHSDFVIISLVHLSDLLLQELKITSEQEEVLEELETFTRELQEVAYHYPNYYLLVQTLILKSKLALIGGKIREATELIDEAISVAGQKGLTVLKGRAEEQKNRLIEEVHKWEVIIASNPSVVERLNQSDVLDYMREVVQKFEL